MPLGIKAALLACLLSVLAPLLAPGALLRAAAHEVGDDLMANGGFELSTSGIPDNWIPYMGWTNPELALTDEEAKTGENSFRISTQAATNPWIAQEIFIEPGVTYNASAWLKGFDVEGSGAGFKFEFYKGDHRTSANHLGYDSTHKLTPSEFDGDWQNLNLTFTAPPEATILCLYVRLYGVGTVYFDDVSLTLVQQRAMIDLSTDETFYYSDLTEGRADAQFYSPDGILSDKQATARLYRESTGVSVATYGPVAANQPLAFTFDPSLMEKEEPYKLEVRLLDSSANELEKAEKTVYRYDRPTMLREDGTLLIDGEPFFPVMAYHVRQTDYPFLGQAGVNTVQGGVTNNSATMRGALNVAQQNGLKVLVPLYYNMNVQENAALTADFVTNLKDHPAVLGWMIMDEPIQNNKTTEELADAYRLIHSIDKAHPTYMVEAPESAYETVSQLTDIFATDVYPFPFSPISVIGERTAAAKQAAGSHKPILNVLQAFMNPPIWPYLPTIGEVRNMAYQSLLNGAQGLGYYSFNEDEFTMRESVLWPGMQDFRPETELLGHLIVDTTIVAKGKGTDTYWQLWQDGDDLYAAAVNTSGQSRQAVIPLDFAGYRADLLYGDSRTTRDEQNDELTIDLGPEQSLLYRVTPFAAMAAQATDAADEAAGLSADPYWTSRMSQLDAELGDIADELADTVPNVTAALGDALDALSIVGELTDWADALTGGAKQQMLDALKQIAGKLGPLAGSYVQAGLHLAGAQIVGQSEPNELTVSLHDGAAVDLQNVNVTLEFAESFALAPMTWATASLASGQTADHAFDFDISALVPQDRYRLKADVSFEYADRPGVTVSVDHYIDYKYTDLLNAETNPSAIAVNKEGAYPFAVKLSSLASRGLTVSLEPDLPAGFDMDLPASLSLAADEQQTVSGTVYVPAGLADGAYTAAIDVRADGQLVRSLTLDIDVSRNLLPNPGFEKGAFAPTGWGMRDSVWSQDETHSGEYSLALLTDPANAWNTASSGLIAVEPGSKYILSGWIKNDSSTGSASIGLRQSKAGGATTVSYTWQAADPSSDWTRYELEVVPASATEFIQVYVLSDTSTNGTAWFDDLYLDRVPNEPEFALDAEAVPGTIISDAGGGFAFDLELANNVTRSLDVTFGADLPTGMTMELPASVTLPANGQTSVNGTVYVPSTVTEGVYEATIQVKVDGATVRSVPLAVRINNNLLNNPGFEQSSASGTSPAGWVMRAGVWTQDETHGGDYAVSLLPDSSNAWNIIVSDLIPTVPGNRYVLRGWAKNDSTAGPVSIGLRQVKADNVSTVKYTWLATQTDSDWTYYDLTVTPSSTASYVQVFLWTDPTANGTAWFDDLAVVRLPGT